VEFDLRGGPTTQRKDNAEENLLVFLDKPKQRQEGSRRSEAELAAGASRSMHNLRFRRLLVAAVSFVRRFSFRSLEPRSGDEEKLHRAMASLQVSRLKP